MVIIQINKRVLFEESTQNVPSRITLTKAKKIHLRFQIPFYLDEL